MKNREKEYTLTGNQFQFVVEAEEQGLEVDYHYSGRGMYGRYCPAVRIDNDELTRVKFTADVWRDNMGLGWVLYARS